MFEDIPSLMKEEIYDRLFSAEEISRLFDFSFDDIIDEMAEGRIKHISCKEIIYTKLEWFGEWACKRRLNEFAWDRNATLECKQKISLIKSIK